VPIAPLIISGDTLYGTAQDGGNSGRSTVFSLNTDGTAFKTLAVLLSFRRQNLFSTKVATVCNHSATVCESFWVVLPLQLIREKTSARVGRVRKYLKLRVESIEPFAGTNNKRLKPMNTITREGQKTDRRTARSTNQEVRTSFRGMIIGPACEVSCKWMSAA
jgi:hypothetical protein